MKRNITDIEEKIHKVNKNNPRGHVPGRYQIGI